MKAKSVRIEWPTIGIAIAVWALLFGSFLAFPHLPLPLGLGLLAVASGWYGGLQHEVCHGHPTKWKPFNLALAGLPIGLIFPYEVYRSSHLEHHNNSILTDPLKDPESRYVTRQKWESMSPLSKRLLMLERCLIGRLALGPVRVLITTWSGSIAQSKSDPELRRSWTRHLFLVTGILILVYLSPLPVWAYMVGTGLGGTAVSLLRSFAEHGAVSDGSQSAVVDAGPILSLLYFNNNLHEAHHALPNAPWYETRKLADSRGSRELAKDGAGYYRRGYLELAIRYGLRPLGHPVHPDS